MTVPDPTDATEILPLLEVGRGMERLREELAAELEAHPDPQLQALGLTLPELRAQDAISIVLVGQHDAGKSLLVRCLTGRDDIEVGAGPLTDRSTAYDWNGHRLVDTPGVQAGLRAEHDRIADEALLSADVVLFVLTVEGLDDVIARYFTDVRRQLRSVRGLVVVVNKALSERSDRAANEADVRQAVGPTYDVVPVVWTDAKRWSDAGLGSDPERRREESGLRELGATVTDLVESRGATVRLLTPLRAWSDVAQRALAHLAADGSGRDQLADLADLAERLDEQHRIALRDLEGRAAEAVAALTAELRKAGPDVEKTQFARLVQTAADVFDDRFAKDGARRDDNLVAQVALALRDDQGDVLALTGIDVRQLLQDGLAQIARTFGDSQAKPGGMGHQVVTQAWHAVGGKFKPWGAVNASRSISRFATRANVALTVGTAAWQLYRDVQDARERAAQVRRTQDWPGLALQHAESIVAEWQQDAERALEEVHEARAAEVARRRLDVLLKVTEGDEAAERIAGLDRRCLALMRSLTQEDTAWE